MAHKSSFIESFIAVTTTRNGDNVFVYTCVQCKRRVCDGDDGCVNGVGDRVHHRYATVQFTDH